MPVFIFIPETPSFSPLPLKIVEIQKLSSYFYVMSKRVSVDPIYDENVLELQVPQLFYFL